MIVGAAFGNIVDSVAGDPIMPIVGKAVGGLDFSNHCLPLSGQEMTIGLEAAKNAGAVFAHGNFITIAIRFAILAFIIFMIFKQRNRLRREAPTEEKAQTPEDILLLRARSARA